MGDVQLHPAQSTPESKAEYHFEEVEHAKSPLQPDKMNDNEEVELEFHARTWIALAAFLLLNYTQVLALQGPAAVLNYIGTDLHNNEVQSWVIVALSLVQGALGPLISTTSDTFQARKMLLVCTCAISFIGACIAPGSTSIYRLIVANILIGVGFAAVPLAYAVPSEILPRRWRPSAQAGVNIAALLANSSAPLVIGALTKRDAHTGWRYFYWFQAALWGATTVAIFIGYHPPKRHTDLDHLSLRQRINRIDFIGCGLLTAGLALFTAGTSLGGGLYSWTNARTLVTMIIGIVILSAFGIYEWKGTKTGFLNHELFRGGRNKGRTFALCVGLIFLEGTMLFGFGLFYPILTQALFTSDPLLIVARSQACWVPAILSTVFWGYVGTRFRTVREPLIIGFIFFTGGLIGLSTVQPGQSINAIAFSCLFGIGFGAALTLVVTGVQLSTPHALIATATACTTSSRAVAGAMFGAIYTAAFNTRLKKFLPEYVANSALAAGLPASSIADFIQALSEDDTVALGKVPGVTPTIIALGIRSLQQAYADSLRVVFIIAVPFGVVACVASCFLGDLSETMNYHVDAPIEVLHAKQGNEVNTP